MSKADRILLHTPSERAQRIQDFRLETISKSPAGLGAEIIAHLEHLRKLNRRHESRYTGTLPLLPEDNEERVQGSGSIQADNYIPVGNNEIRRLNARSANPDIYFFSVSGESMSPEFLDEDVIEGCHNRNPQNGDTVHCVVRGKHLLKGYCRRGKNVLLRSLNPEFCDLIVKPGVPFHVVGVVEAIVSRKPRPRSGARHE